MRPLLVMLFLLSGVSAQASYVSETIRFKTTMVYSASGSFQLVFDPNLSYQNATVGISILSFNPAFTAPTTADFSYSPGPGNAAYLVIENVLNATGALDYGNGFRLDINPITSQFQYLYYDGPSGGFTSYGVAYISAQAIPEPSPFWLALLPACLPILRRTKRT